VAQLLSRRFSGQGSFEGTLSVLGFGISVASLASLLHDLPDSFLGAIGVLDLRAYEIALNSPTIWRAILWSLYTLSFALFLVLFTEGLAAAQRMRRAPTVGVAVASFAVYQVVFLVFGSGSSVPCRSRRNRSLHAQARHPEGHMKNDHGLVRVRNVGRAVGWVALALLTAAAIYTAAIAVINWGPIGV
jgi:hypothetical protein